MPRVDVTATLDPAAGIARDVRTIPPDGTDRPLWTVAVDVGIGDRRQDDAALDITWVGAAGLRRAGTAVRAAGESIERVALSIPGGLPGGEARRWAPRGASWGSDAESDAAASYRALTVTGTDRVLTRVPAAAVDYPPTDGLAGVDPGPSGTASGLGRAMALQSAAKESIERDAAMRAWYCPDRAHRLPTEAVMSASPEVRRMRDALSGVGVELFCFRLDAVADAQVVLALAVDHVRGVVGAGLGLEPLSAQAVVRAVQESVQIRTLLLDLKRVGDTAQALPPIEREIDRARFWSGPLAIPTIQDWISGTDPVDAAALRTGAQADWLALLDAYTVVDLTGRLPEPIRRLGWAVTRLFCPALQPLRMSEAISWNLCATGVDAHPHPFV